MRSGPVIVLLASLGVSIAWARSPQSGQRGRPASAAQPAQALAYAPCDYDNDGRIDHLLFGPTSPGRLIANLGHGKTEDRTESAGLDQVGFVAQAWWRDLDSDRWQDLIVLAPEGWLRVFSGDGQVFEETTEELAGVPCTNVQGVQFEDYDLNGWLDVRVQCQDGSRTLLFNQGKDLFVPGEDPLALFGSLGGGQTFLGSPPAGCADSIVDQSSPMSCLNASSLPTLGRLYMMTSSLFVGAAGQVGIQTSTPNPAYALDVNGTINVPRIRFPDSSELTSATAAGPEGPQGPEGPEGPPGPSLPAGTILPYAGETPPPGYLLCDGTELLRDDYPALFAAIGTAWGFDTNFTFTLPDLRGRFLRGVDGGAGNDPDAVFRSATNPGGNVGDEVGSLQADGRRGFSGTFAGTTSTNGAHSHTINTNQDDFDECCTGISWANDGGSSGVHKSTNTAGAHSHTTSTTVTFNGESETRPKNVNVNFIIKT